MIRQLTQQRIDEIFDAAEQAEKPHQVLYMEGLYREVLPELFDPAVVEVDGWPAASDATRLYIAEKACAFDRKHHPDVLPGGAWLQKGFTSSDTDLPDWQVDTSTCTFKYADTAPQPAA